MTESADTAVLLRVARVLIECTTQQEALLRELQTIRLSVPASTDTASDDLGTNEDATKERLEPEEPTPRAEDKIRAVRFTQSLGGGLFSTSPPVDPPADAAQPAVVPTSLTTPETATSLPPALTTGASDGGVLLVPAATAPLDLPPAQSAGEVDAIGAERTDRDQDPFDRLSDAPTGEATAETPVTDPIALGPTGAQGTSGAEVNDRPTATDGLAPVSGPDNGSRTSDWDSVGRTLTMPPPIPGTRIDKPAGQPAAETAPPRPADNTIADDLLSGLPPPAPETRIFLPQAPPVKSPVLADEARGSEAHSGFDPPPRPSVWGTTQKNAAPPEPPPGYEPYVPAATSDPSGSSDVAPVQPQASSVDDPPVGRTKGDYDFFSDLDKKLAELPEHDEGGWN
jgi:hypothetical protein